MTENTIKNINFDYIFNEVKPITEYGIKKKQETEPFKKGQEADLKIEFNKIRAFIESKKRRDIIDVLKHVKNIHETLERSKNNQVLDEVELFEIKNFLIQVKKMDKILKTMSIDDLKLTPLPQLFELLDPAHENLNTFYIYDEYTENLKAIRTEKKQIEKNIHLLKKKIKEETEKKYDVKFNLKNEITISKSQKDKVDELIKDTNLRVSGENYLNVVLKIKNNDSIDILEHKYEILSNEEEEEEFKIRQNISTEIKKCYDIMHKNTRIIGETDFIIAKANYAQKTNSVEPEIIYSLEIAVKGGRNLKLEKTLKEKHIEYVPVDLNLRKNVICITGANMGGKTVSLRMIGQIAGLASYGMFVPCQYARLCLFDHIYISVGDDQSIEKGLSTFGAEIVNLKEALDNSHERCLILVDELAGGTNPKEGYAITKAVVNYLKKKNCITVLTTHYDNVASDEEIQNLQVAGLMLPGEADILKINNIDQISKYMDYRLIEVKYKSDIPKNALSIAKMAGIYSEIIEDAENYL
ncbi:MAG: DNA mismatch repair protein MutS [Sedimentibacter sp.]|uniref:lysine 5,6-aminomutase reactivase ATPase KamC n=1 Tax=Sedimentibacter sp. TaxID=1960295 RepID=UPI002980DAAB|nr:DNA mismatch repair protein MutS [Sedimentibacter sp.]MDW5299421.1 DNA mismatch repair protein MutS [Sedimentibacter sp.]